MKEIFGKNYKRGDLLYEFPSETRLTVYRRLDIELWFIASWSSKSNTGARATPLPRPKSTEFIYTLDVFEEVSRW